MFGAIAGGIASALAGGAMSKLFGGGQKAASGGIQGDVLATDKDRKSGSAGMPRPISYAVFCLKKKKSSNNPQAGCLRYAPRACDSMRDAVKCRAHYEHLV